LQGVKQATLTQLSVSLNQLKPMPTVSWMPSRAWLEVIALDFARRLKLANPLSAQELANCASRDAARLLNLAPWHFRLLVGAVEIFASMWCVFFRIFTLRMIGRQWEITIFEKVPIVAAPLLRLYRSLVALSWFEQPEVLATLGVTETAEARQERFRELRHNIL
jgi:hypothetical protein